MALRTVNVIADADDRTFPTVNIVASGDHTFETCNLAAGADPQFETVQAAASTVAGLPTLIVPDYVP